jgi:hypothetical protein
MEDNIHYTRAFCRDDGQWQIDVLGSLCMSQAEYDRLCNGEEIQISIVRVEEQ